MTMTMAVLKVSVSKNPDADKIAEVAIQTDQPLENDMTRAYRFMIESGGRKLWQQWFDHEPIYLMQESGVGFEASIAAFPTNPRTDYGYIKLVRQL